MEKGRNQGGKIVNSSKTPDLLADYDNLSPLMRRYFRNLPYKYAARDFAHYPDKFLPIVREGHAKQIQQNALATYGPDHPQAQGEMLCPLKE